MPDTSTPPTPTSVTIRLRGGAASYAYAVGPLATLTRWGRVFATHYMHS